MAVNDLGPTAVLRIGELSRRLGVTEHALRAWERRYGLLRPVRSAGGFRLYSEADLQRVRRMQEHLAHGLSTAEAARAAIEDEQSTGATADTGDGRRPGTPAAPRLDGPGASGLAEHALSDAADVLARALDDFDEPAAHAVLDRLLGTLTVEAVLRDVLLPYLQELGERWERGEVSVAQEHFASNVVRTRLAGIAQGWGNGRGPRAVLACLPGELHDIALLAFGIVLARNGWRVDFLGASTPVDDLVGMVEATRPAIVVLAASTRDRFDGLTEPLARLASTVPVAIAGAGATRAMTDAIGAELLTDDPVTAAERLPWPPAS